jgi:hypothetical protein
MGASLLVSLFYRTMAFAASLAKSIGVLRHPHYSALSLNGKPA